MSILSKIKAATSTVVEAAIGCGVCDPNRLGIPDGCQCDFLDETSPTTADVQRTK